MGLLTAKKDRLLAEKLAARDAKKLEQDANALLKGFKERREAEAARRQTATDSEYWVTICFESRADKDAFVKQFELDQCPMIPGTIGDKYVNGYDLIDRWDQPAEPPQGNNE